MTEKLVSIVLPVYNGERFISESIESILKQSYKNIELIIVNDCSTDNTLSIIEEYKRKDSRIQIIHNAENKRLPASLNIGFSVARGEYYSWTSDDNIYSENAIGRLVEELESDSNCVLVYSDLVHIDEKGKIIKTSHQFAPRYLSAANIIGASFLYRKTAAEQVGLYNEKLFLAEDYEYWVRLAKTGKLRHISECLYYYREHGGSLTATRQEQIKAAAYKVMEDNFLFLYAYAEKPRLQREMLFQMYRKKQETNDARDCYHLICSLNPRMKIILPIRIFKKKITRWLARTFPNVSDKIKTM